MEKNSLITILTIITVIVIAYFLITRGNGVSKELAQCIGQNSVLYIQLGCHACEIQEDMFSENAKYLNTVDCFYEREKCGGIQATPTWEIKGQRYRGVQSIENLKELTGC